jgi:Xaa-Pro aminopeptidase
MIPPQPLSPLLQTSLLKRRQQLADRLEAPVILWSGCSSPRNYPANTYPFRASSHFLYFAGLPLEHAAIRLEQGSLELFMEDEDPAAALWHGESACRSQIAAWIQAKGDYPLSALKSRATGAVSIPNQDGTTHQQQIEILGRQVSIAPETEDLALAKALIELRLIQDEAALDQLRQAAAVTVAAHRAGMAATRSAHT